MCGIVGWINHKKDIRNYGSVIEDMRETLSHRGPDEEGEYITYHALLGHKRLVVVDPEGGKQPMVEHVAGKAYAMIYNGELYNTDELREELMEKGYSFNSYSDTEVLLKSYIHWGKECVTYLNGIFAFAVWNEKEQELFLARDRLGVKPLFYTQVEDNFLFASELKALLKHPDVKPKVDEQGLLQLLGLGPARNNGSGIFKNIYEVKPGETIAYGTDARLHKNVYWDLKAEEHHESYEDTREHLTELLKDAINRQLVADVPVCTFLSGGLDSSIISSLSSQAMDKKGYVLDTFSIDYQDNKKFFRSSRFQPSLDHKWIDIMVNEIDSKHHNIILSNEGLIDALENAVLANDLPGMADIDSSLYLFCREVKKHATVGLSGECADEIFGGYPWFTRDEDLNATTFPWSKYVEHRQSILADRYQKIPLREFVQNEFNETVKSGHYSDNPLEARVQRMTRLNVKWFMMTLLNRKDRMSMSNSLEVRVPFADHRLVEYAYNIPWHIKRYKGQEKGILREAVADILPEAIVRRKKNPYPKTVHPHYLKLIQKRMRIIMNDPNAPIKEVLNNQVLKEIINTGGDAFKVPWYGQLMTGPQLLAYFYQLNYWMETYHVEI